MIQGFPYKLQYLNGTSEDDVPGGCDFQTEDDLRVAAKRHEAEGRQVRGLFKSEMSHGGGNVSLSVVECYRTPGSSFPGTYDDDGLREESLKK